MDGHRFDHLLTALASPAVRRDSLRLFAAIAIAFLLPAAALPGEATSGRGKGKKPKRKGKRKRKKQVKKEECPRGFVTCSDNPPRCCPVSNPICCPFIAAIDQAACCTTNEFCCGEGCCPGETNCCPARVGTNRMGVCCNGKCCGGPSDCPEGQFCDAIGCCDNNCNPTQGCVNDCCLDGFACVATVTGERQCCAAEHVCSGSQTGCCSPGTTCVPRIDPPLGTPTHACVT